MTTIVGLRKDESTIIAADTLVITPGTRLGHTNKMILVNSDLPDGTKYTTCIAVAGMATSLFALRSILRESNYQWTDEDEVYESLLAIHGELREHHGLRVVEDEDNDAYESSQFQALIGNRFGLWKVLSCREIIGSEPIHALGSGSEFALGALTVLGINDPVKNADRAVRVAALHDLATGGEPQVWQSN